MTVEVRIQTLQVTVTVTMADGTIVVIVPK